VSNKPKRRKLTIVERKLKAEELEARRKRMFGARYLPAYS
jgi:hypothetical protein